MGWRKLLSRILWDNWCARYIIISAVGGIIASITFGLAQFMPDYLAVSLMFSIGMVIWWVVVGLPKKATLKAWAFVAVGWAAVVCLTYGHLLNQKDDSKRDIWSSIGLVLFLATVVVVAYIYFTDEDRNRKQPGPPQ